MNIDTNILNSFVLIPLAMAAFLARKISNSWLSPGAFFALIWFIYTTSCILLAPGFQPRIMGLWVLIIFTYAVVIGDILLTKGKILSGLSQTIKRTSIPRLNTMFYTIAILVLISATGLVWVSTFGFNRFLLEKNIMNLVLLPNLYAVERYGADSTLPWTMRAVISLTYPASILGGFTSYFMYGWKKRFCYLPVVISILYGSLFAVRAGVLLSFILTFTGLAVARVGFSRNLNVWFNRMIINSSIVIVLLFSLYIALQWLRIGVDDVFIFREVMTIAKAALFGPLPAFTHWFQLYDFPGLSMGINTFAAPFDWIGLTVRKAGFYTDFTRIGTSHINIYTILRGLVQDFGLLGGSVFCFGLGYFGRIAFEAVRNGRILWSVPLAAIYTFILFSPLISVFNTTSIIAAFLIFYAILVISLRPI